MSDIIWVLPALAPFAIIGLWIWTRHQAKMAEKHDQLPNRSDPDSERMREEMKYLKDRVAVLEQITTDGHSTRQLENEIEKLKDR